MTKIETIEKRMDILLDCLSAGDIPYCIPVKRIIDEVMGRCEPKYLNVQYKEGIAENRVYSDISVCYCMYEAEWVCLNSIVDESMERGENAFLAVLQTKLEKKKHLFHEAEDIIAKIREYGRLQLAAVADSSSDQTVKPEAFYTSLLKLMEAQDEGGKYRFCKKAHWMAVFRVAIDKKLMPEGDFEQFKHYINELHLPACRVELSIDSLIKAYEGIYMKPLKEWTAAGYQRKKNDGKRPNLKPFFDMKWLADQFVALLDR